MNQIGREKLKVALIAAPYVSIPPFGYGGAERRIDALSKELVKKGIDLTLFFFFYSKTNVPLEKICGRCLSSNKDYDHLRDKIKKLPNINQRTIKLIDSQHYDLINIHNYENSDLIEKLSERDTPVLVSVRHALTPIIEEIYTQFKDNPNVYFHGVSQNQVQTLNPSMHFIYNGENPILYCPVDNITKKRPFFFSIGNLNPIKGHSVAINLAKKIGLDLVLSTEALRGHGPENYFKNKIKPRIDVDISSYKESFLKDMICGEYSFGRGKIINFGSSTDLEKKILYQHARFTQFLGKLEVEESIDACPGVIMESLLSGTPILGVKGSVSEEMVKENIAGLNISSLEEVPSRLMELSYLDPNKIRSFAVENYSSEIMADNYIKLYNKIMGKKNC